MCNTFFCIPYKKNDIEHLLIKHLTGFSKTKNIRARLKLKKFLVPKLHIHKGSDSNMDSENIPFLATLKGQCHKIFCFWFFYELVSPHPRVFHEDHLEFFPKFATGVVDTGGQPLAANISANFQKNS